MSSIFYLLFGGEFRAVALGEGVDGLAALLEHGGEEGLLFGVGEGLALVDLF